MKLWYILFIHWDHVHFFVLQVGLYFDRFTGRHYEPCESVMEQYPDDLEVTRQKIDQYFAEQRDKDPASPPEDDDDWNLFWVF